MNSQLYAHIEAYDCCDDGNKDDEKSPVSLGNPVNVFDDDANISAKVQLCKTNSDREDKVVLVLESTVVYFPIGAAFLLTLLFNKELIAYLSIATISFAWLVCWQHQQSTNIFSLQSQQKHSSQLIGKKSSVRKKFPSRSSIPSNNNKNWEEDICICRNELSRLLGLIGAPPMVGRNEFDDEQDKNRFGDIDTNLGIHDDRIFDRIHDFLEAHTQVILTIDKALYWVKISSSLHWGLGPHSQCVERVERAAMSKELFSARHRSADRRNNRIKDLDGNNSILSETTTSAPSPASSVRVKQGRIDKPQNKIDSSSILALSSARRNIAHAIVNEAHSIVKTIRMIDNFVLRQKFPNVTVSGEEANDSEYNNNRIYNNNISHTVVDDEYDHDHIVENELLEVPDVIDIAWIKASRKYLANLLTYSAERLCARKSLRILSSPASDNKHEVPLSPISQPLQILNESMWNARNVRDYLTSHLLLDDDQSPIPLVSSVRPIIRSDGVDNEYKLILPLLHYQKQLDALGAALWSFQHYSYSQHVDSTTSDVSGARKTKEKDKISQKDQYHRNEQNSIMALRRSSAKLTWWNQVKEISATCQTLEQEIGNRFFSPSEYDRTRNTERNQDSSDECSVPIGSNIDNECEAQSYEHIEGENSQNYKQRKMPCLIATKTLVFSGEGSKERRSTNKMKQNSMVDVDSGSRKLQTEGQSTTISLPSVRDPFTEQLLVRELQNRIRSVAALREEEQQVDPSRVEFQDEDDDLSSQEAMTVDENIVEATDAFCDENALTGNVTRVETNETAGRKREITTNIFLGASGSLLDELKRNICPDHLVGDPKVIIDTDKIVGETTTDDTFLA